MLSTFEIFFCFLGSKARGQENIWILKKFKRPDGNWLDENPFCFAFDIYAEFNGIRRVFCFSKSSLFSYTVWCQIVLAICCRHGRRNTLRNRYNNPRSNFSWGTFVNIFITLAHSFSPHHALYFVIECFNRREMIAVEISIHKIQFIIKITELPDYHFRSITNRSILGKFYRSPTQYAVHVPFFSHYPSWHLWRSYNINIYSTGKLGLYHNYLRSGGYY